MRLQSYLCPYLSKPVNPTGNQPWIFIGRTDAEAEFLILRPPNVKSWFTEKTLMLGQIQGKTRRGQQRMKWLDGITDSKDTSLSKLWEIMKKRVVWHATVHGVAKNKTRLTDRTTIYLLISSINLSHLSIIYQCLSSNSLYHLTIYLCVYMLKNTNWLMGRQEKSYKHNGNYKYTERGN